MGRPVFPAAVSFELHPRLSAGSFSLGRIFGCHLLLKNNSIFPWFLLVPETDVEDMDDMPLDQYRDACEAIRLVSIFVKQHYKPEKLNVGYIGNKVRQMHIHVVARYTDDATWPDTVWSFEGKELYQDDQVTAIRAAAQAALGSALEPV